MNINMENIEEPVEEKIPDILSSEFHDVFPILANMLDIKSFFKLAMSCKEMYRRCIVDKNVKIDVYENFIEVVDEDGSPEFYLTSSVRGRHRKLYLATLRRMKFNVILSAVQIHASSGVNYSFLETTRNYLNEIGVKRVHNLEILGPFREWGAVVAFLKDFRMGKFNITGTPANEVPLPILRSILQLNLEEFIYSIPVEVLLEVDSPIERIESDFHEAIQKDTLMQILLKIQTGSLNDLCLKATFDWSTFDTLPFDYEGPLPENRPLIFKRSENNGTNVYWCLNWQGGVTKCFSSGRREIEIFKCHSQNYPPILRNEEDVLNDLSKEDCSTSCLASHFHKFSSKFPMIGPSHEGALPKERPLWCKASENRFWLLKEDDELMECAWENGYAKWSHFPSVLLRPVGHAALAKHIFRKSLQMKIEHKRDFYCEGREELDGWFEGIHVLGFNSSGDLPKERPVIFEKNFIGGKKLHVILCDDDFLLHCELNGKKVTLTPCPSWRRPPCLLTAEHVKDMLSNSPYHHVFNIRMDVEMFRTGFDLFKNSSLNPTSLPNQRPLVFEKSKKNVNDELVEERWFSIFRQVMKAIWERGLATLQPFDRNSIPLEFMKGLFREFAESNSFTDTIVMDHEQLDSCLEQFTMVPFEYSGMSPGEYPLAFVKKVAYHTCCDDPSHCACSDIIIRVWFLWENMETTQGAWGESTPHGIQFFPCYDSDELPPYLRSKEHLRHLLQYNRWKDEYETLCWFGSVEDFLSHLEEYQKIPFDHEGPLPEERPLFFERDERGHLYRYLLRGDGIFIECFWGQGSSHAIIRQISSSPRHFPPSLSSLFIF